MQEDTAEDCAGCSNQMQSGGFLSHQRTGDDLEPRLWAWNVAEVLVCLLVKRVILRWYSGMVIYVLVVKYGSAIAHGG